MNWKITLIGVLSGVGILLITLELIRRKALKERYALLWLLMAFVLIVLSAWSTLLQKIANLLDIYYPPSIIFSLSLVFIFIILIHLSVILSSQSRINNRIIQKVAILEEEIQSLKTKNAASEESEKDAAVDAGMRDTEQPS